jgi:hypothetical protein
MEMHAPFGVKKSEGEKPLERNRIRWVTILKGFFKIRMEIKELS